jgi:hypothetical protein
MRGLYLDIRRSTLVCSAYVDASVHGIGTGTHMPFLLDLAVLVCHLCAADHVSWC